MYHSLDKVTSHFLHFFPAALTWAVRWYPPAALQERLDSLPADADAWERSDVWSLVLVPMLAYLVWAVYYYVTVFVISSKKIQDRGYETLFLYVTRSRRSLFARAVLRFPRPLQPAAYMAVHQLLTFLTLLLAMIWWRSKLASAAFLIAIFTASAWSGAGFYFDVFARRYVAGLGLKSHGEPGSGSKADAEVESTARAKCD